MEEKKIDNSSHLPTYGVGPIYGIVCVIITILAVVGGHANCFSKGIIEHLRIPFVILGSILIIFGIWLWVKAVILDKIDQGIVSNKLITSGSYAFVRNPIYSAIMIALTGILFISGNVYFYWLPFLYWLMMTILMKCTEEKWLTELYGQEYLDYCKKVNRCIPWFPKQETE